MPKPTVSMLAAKYPDCPEGMISGLINYGWDGIPTGGFLKAVLENNLSEACARADNVNRYRLFDIVNLIYNELDRRSWGSPEKVKAWLEMETS